MVTFFIYFSMDKINIIHILSAKNDPLCMYPFINLSICILWNYCVSFTFIDEIFDLFIRVLV